MWRRFWQWAIGSSEGDPVYNKLFGSILDSSVWLESASTRLVWLTFLAAMDETGYARFAAVANLAHRARVPLEETQAAVAVLEAPDPTSSDPTNEGRRIERTPGGWLVLNSEKYRQIVTREESKRLHRDRQTRYRQSQKEKVTPRDAGVTPHAVRVTESDTEVHVDQEQQEQSAAAPPTLFSSEPTEKPGMWPRPAPEPLPAMDEPPGLTELRAPARAFIDPPPVPTDIETLRVLTKIAHTVMDAVDAGKVQPEFDAPGAVSLKWWNDQVQIAAARGEVAWTVTEVRKAVDSANAQRQRQTPQDAAIRMLREYLGQHPQGRAGVPVDAVRKAIFERAKVAWSDERFDAWRDEVVRLAWQVSTWRAAGELFVYADGKLRLR